MAARFSVRRPGSKIIADYYTEQVRETTRGMEDLRDTFLPFFPSCPQLFPMYGCEAYINYPARRNCSAAIAAELPPFATDQLLFL